ncbi:MAG: M1 family metallopeptidase [Chitinophagaceae bacterium]
MKYFFKAAPLVLLLTLTKISFGQYTHQDTLRGSITPERAWWDVLRYDLAVKPDYDNKTIWGKTTIEYKVLPGQKSDYLQIDLQKPLTFDSIFYDNKMYINYPGKPYYNDGNAWFIPLPRAAAGSIHSITIVYHGKPREAVRAPWDGGWIFTKDEKGRQWMTVACQGLGASVWYPCKDHQSDEPDNGASLTMTVADSLVAVGNGRLVNKTNNNNGTTSWKWEVKNPINNYTIIPYIGKYVNWTEQFTGEKGKLDCSYWVMDYDLEKAKKQFGRDVKLMLKCFEEWFGPYPFYEDSYKLVETPHLGMEHQSAVAYGNKFLDGYLGRDLSGTGWGLKWDYIIVHESGHEWFANNITTKDIADMWVHEGFTNYSEILFTECQSGKKAGEEYVQGIRAKIQNSSPIIGPYGVNKEGSGDMYAKGANTIHTIRQVINDDAVFKQILRGLGEKFYHKTVNSSDVEKYFIEKSGKDLSKIFDQYLRNAKIPMLEWKVEGETISYRWADCINGFNMPVKLTNGVWLTPGTSWKTINAKETANTIEADPNFYIKTKKL